MQLLVGTQQDQSDGGIMACRFEPSSGQFEKARLAAHVERPTWLCQHPGKAVVYAVSEVGNRDARIGSLHAFAVEPDGGLEAMNAVSAMGGGPTDLAMDRLGRTLFVANFGGGQALSVPVAPDGTLSDVASVCRHEGSGPHRRQKSPHPHGVTPSPDGRMLLVPDMGADRIFLHEVDSESASLVCNARPAVELPAGSGPRLLRFAPSGRYAYLLTELSAELFGFAWDARTGALSEVCRVPLDHEAFAGEPSAAALEMSQDGRFLYASNRRTHTIEVFELDAQNGDAVHVQSIASGGEKPWSVTLSPEGDWLFVTNQASDRVVAMARAPGSGRLSPPAGEGVFIATPSCVICL